MKWNEFLQKIKDANKLKKDKKLSIPVLAILIFSGTFDSFIEEDIEPGVEIYRSMFEELKKAKKSKASLPPKKKGESIGLDEVKSMLQLSIWRAQRSPIVKKVDFEPFLEAALKNFGFSRVHKEGSIFKFARGADRTNNKPEVLGTANWSKLFADKNRLDLFKDGRQLMIYGVVTDTKLLRYGPMKEKERLVFRIFTGQETTDELVLWPSRDTGFISEAIKHEIKDGSTGFCLVKPTTYRDKPTATIVRFVRLAV